ncbi:hypothetical protein HPB49_015177 [Dermacentor silvarum]|uniref:Uncharacterized protein n=1 Tax=Dermacentor silvarum TaxID=543639 RepID=A0ACB8CRX3_DERSI|nr:hypothetical protein HPB49_015177 [Dermacentor silvarum]
MPGASPSSANHRQPTMMEVQVEGTTLREEDYDPADWTKIIGTYQGKSQSKARMEDTNGVRGKQKASEERTETLPASTWRPTYRPNPAHLRATQQVKRKSRQMAPLPQHAIKVVFRSQGGLFLPNIQPQLLLRCLCETAKIPMGEEVQLRVHPMNNTKRRDIECFWDETEEELLQDLQARNPEAGILLARRMGKSKSILITFAQGPIPVESSTMAEYTCARPIGRDQRPARTVAPQDTDMMCVQNRKYRDVQDAAKITAKTEHVKHLTGTGWCKATKRQQTTKPPVNRETTGRRQLHPEDFPTWNPSAPPKAPEELTWAERIVRKPDPRDEEMIRLREESSSPAETSTSTPPTKKKRKDVPPPSAKTTELEQSDKAAEMEAQFEAKLEAKLTAKLAHFQQQMRDEFQQFLDKRLQTLEARFPTLEARIDSLIDERFKILENKLDTFCTQLRTQMGLMVAEATNQMQTVPLPHTTHPPSTSQTSGQQNGR